MDNAKLTQTICNSCVFGDDPGCYSDDVRSCNSYRNSSNAQEKVSCCDDTEDKHVDYTEDLKKVMGTYCKPGKRITEISFKEDAQEITDLLKPAKIKVSVEFTVVYGGEAQ